MADTLTYYEACYARAGLAAQRRYPNEELCRFMGRHYFGVPREQRSSMRILEVGCGSGANLWMIAREGFDAYGIDLSLEAIRLCRLMLESYAAKASLQVADMTALPFPNSCFNAIVDVFSAYCFGNQLFAKYLDEVQRLLTPGGRYFAYAPSKRSDAFLNHAPSGLLDQSTLDGISRTDSPFHGNLYPFRFTTGAEYAAVLEQRRLRPNYNEIVGRTYSNGNEYFEFVVIAAEKLP
jgi:SAM-dependent methyltransferase